MSWEGYSLKTDLKLFEMVHEVMLWERYCGSTGQICRAPLTVFVKLIDEDEGEISFKRLIEISFERFFAVVQSVGQLVELPQGVYCIDNDRQGSRPRVAVGAGKKIYFLRTLPGFSLQPK